MGSFWTPNLGYTLGAGVVGLLGGWGQIPIDQTKQALQITAGQQKESITKEAIAIFAVLSIIPAILQGVTIAALVDLILPKEDPFLGKTLIWGFSGLAGFSFWCLQAYIPKKWASVLIQVMVKVAIVALNIPHLIEGSTQDEKREIGGAVIAVIGFISLFHHCKAFKPLSTEIRANRGELISDYQIAQQGKILTLWGRGMKEGRMFRMRRRVVWELFKQSRSTSSRRGAMVPKAGSRNPLLDNDSDRGSDSDKDLHRRKERV